MANRNKLQISTNIILMILIVAGVLAVVNFLAQKKFFRLDLTENSQYTISDATREIVTNLDDLVNVKIFFSRKLPPQMVNLENQISDLFDELVAYSNGNLRVEYIDPGDDPELQQLAQSFTIPQVQLNIYEKDKAEVTSAYMGIGFMYGDRKEAIPIIQNLQSLEYDVASRLLKLTRDEVETVGFLVGHEGPDIYDDAQYGALRRELEKEYRVTMVDLTSGNTIPPEVDTLVVAGPKTILKEREKFEIDQFIMRGGRGIFLLDPVKMNPGLQAQPQPTNLDDLLAHYGVRVSRDLVIDSLNSMASFSRGYMRYSLPYPYWPRIHKQNFNRDNPVVNKLDGLTLPWCSPLRLLTAEVEEVAVPAGEEPDGEEAVTADATGEGEDEATAEAEVAEAKSTRVEQGGDVENVRGIVLATTTQFGSVLKSPFNLDPQQKFNPGETGRYPLAVALVGEFTSFYRDRPIPKKLTGEEDDSQMDLSAMLSPDGGEEEEREEILEQSPSTQIIVVGNALFASANYAAQFPGNGIFVLNAVDWATRGGDLIDIRSRAVVDRPLKELSASKKTMVRFLNNFGISLLVVLFGLYRFYSRRKTRTDAVLQTGE
jgi:ABC-type uncharacterized transport system involved in gliding motility auxiliary subunit